MITQLLKRRIFAAISENQYARLVQHTVLLIAAVFFVAGFRLIAEMDLTREQMALGFCVVFALVLQCGMLWVLVEIARKLMQKTP